MGCMRVLPLTLSSVHASTPVASLPMFFSPDLLERRDSGYGLLWYVYPNMLSGNISLYALFSGSQRLSARSPRSRNSPDAPYSRPTFPNYAVSLLSLRSHWL